MKYFAILSVIAVCGAILSHAGDSTGRAAAAGAAAGAGAGADSPCGDVNADGRLDLSDPVRLLQHIFRGGPAPICESTNPEPADPLLLDRIAQTSADGLARFPADDLFLELPPETAEFYGRVHQFLLEGTQAHSWGQRELELYATQVESAAVGFEASLAQFASTTSASWELQCTRERRVCIGEECGPGSHSWPCFCCAPCNVAWMVCLADCIL